MNAEAVRSKDAKDCVSAIYSSSAASRFRTKALRIVDFFHVYDYI